MSAKEEKEKKENKAIKEAAKLLVKKAWITEELYAPIVYWSIDNLSDETKKTPGISETILDLETRYECGIKTFSPYNTWRVKLQHYPVIQRTEIWLSVNSEDCKEEILLSAHGMQPYWERMLDILMKFENSWHEKAQFILESLEVFNQRVKSANPLAAKILDPISEKIMAQYDEAEEKEGKLEVLQKENEKLVSQFHGFIVFVRRVSEKLEKTKQWFKSKKIAEIREEIDMKIASVIDALSGTDPALLKEWTKEWAVNKLDEIKELNKAKNKKAKREALRDVLRTKDLLNTR